MLGDIGGGALHLALGMIAGILRARIDGTGQVIDAAVIDGAANMLNLLLSLHARESGGFDRGTKAFDASHWGGRSYQCADGGWINIAPLEPKFYDVLIKTLELDQDPLFALGQRDRALWPVLTEQLTHLFLTRTRGAWCELLEGTDSCFAPVLSPPQAAQHPHMEARGVYRMVDDVLQAAPAPRFSETPSQDPKGVPRRGMHTREILEEIGVSAERIDRLAEVAANLTSRASK